jgi:hypothetical protein
MKVTELYEFRMWLDHNDDWCVARKQRVDRWWRKPEVRWYHYWYAGHREKLYMLRLLKSWIETQRKLERPIEYTYFSEAKLDQMIAEEEAKKN